MWKRIKCFFGFHQWDASTYREYSRGTKLLIVYGCANCSSTDMILL
jgi:hypothetical protein